MYIVYLCVLSGQGVPQRENILDKSAEWRELRIIPQVYPVLNVMSQFKQWPWWQNANDTELSNVNRTLKKRGVSQRTLGTHSVTI